MITSTLSKLSFDQYRRKVRQELHLKRVQDKDVSEARLFSDAQKLDAQLVSAGYKLAYPTGWVQDRKPSSLQPLISDLNTEDIAVAGED